ncbi:ANK2, partial [Symbiodinium sp. KB8]
MYTVHADVLLKMTKVEPHEQLKAWGKLVKFTDDLGRAAFVSHQWLTQQHPDPDFKQMRTLQDAVRRILHSSGSLGLDIVTEAMVQTAKPLPLKDFQANALFFWYDYFSCPQLARSTLVIERTSTTQADAISSIPAYVARCAFFLALCPVLDCPAEDKETSIEAVGTALSFPSGPVGQGNFGVEEDRQKLAPVMRRILMQKLVYCLRVGDLPGFRRYLNLQTVHLRGLDIEPVAGLLPSCEAHGDDAVAEFLHQNGLRSVGKADKAGWCPLHYAALAGNVEVLRSLLDQRADVNRRTSKDEPMLGLPLWLSALDVTVLYKHHEATRLLVGARAQLEGGTLQAVLAAALSDNPEGIRVLCSAGASPLARNLLGFSSYQNAAAFGATAAIEELVMQTPPTRLDLSRALLCAAGFRGGSAELVQRLIDLRADVDIQMNVTRDIGTVGRLLFAAKSFQHRLGRKTGLTAVCCHMHGSTPLMQAISSAQFEAAAALIAAGSRLDLRNGRNWTAADFAWGQTIPDFL